MTKPFSEWTVLPHSRLVRLEDNILSVTGTLHMAPMGDVQRRMTIVRLNGSRLVIYSAIALDEAEMRVIEVFGSPTYLIVPNDIHRMDAQIWKQRYPSLVVITPAAARAKVEEVVHVDDTVVAFGDPAVHFVIVPGTAEREAALLVESEAGATLVLNDLIFNLANRPGLVGWVFKALGMTGEEPHVPPLIKLRQVKDKDALRAQLLNWSQLPNLKRIVVSHGNIIENEPGLVLRRISDELAT